MNKTITLLAIFFGLPIATYAETLTLDPDHTHVRFAIGHMGTSTNHGGFYNLTGELNYDRAAKTGAINLIIPMSSLDTNTKAFNEHLLSKDFFNAAKYPTATFTSTQWHFDKDKVTQVDGNLTLLGKTRPISLTATNFNCYFNFILKKPACGGDFVPTIDRSQWGIDKYVGLGIPKEVTLNIQVEGSHKAK